MTQQPRQTAEIASYHAHIYFRSPAEREDAEWIRGQIASRFRLRLGQWREVPVGPHSVPMFQIAFTTGLFAVVVPWLMLNHRGLSILIHPNTIYPRADHVDDAVWLGARLEVFADRLSITQAVADEAGESNTEPSLAQ
jgi:DOPA 4,5-dioxygenase